MTRTLRHHGVAFTLIELLISVSLATVLVGIVAATSIQAQKAMNSSLGRLAAAQQAKGLFADLERDLGATIPLTNPPIQPFDKDALDATKAQRPLAFEAVTATDSGGGVRSYDKIRIFTSATDPLIVDPVTKEPKAVRRVVEYGAESNATGPILTKPPGGGSDVARLRKKVLKQATVDSTTASANPPDVLLLDNVLSFQVEYLNAHAGKQAVFVAPDDASKSGDAFLLEGKVDLVPAPDSGDPEGAWKAPYLVRALAGPPSGRTLLSSVAVGGEILLPVDAAGSARNQFLVRARNKVVSSTDADGKPFNEVDEILVNERLQPRSDVLGQAWVPPTMIRVTVTLPFGKGPGAETARFSRVFPVAR